MILKRGTATLFHAQTRKFTTVVHQAPTVHARSSHHGQGLNSRTQHEHTKRQLCTQPIAPADAAQHSAPGALSGPSQLNREPTCEAKEEVWWELPSRRTSACRARARRRSVRAHARSWAGQTRADRRTFERSARRVEDTCGWRTCRAGRGAHSAASARRYGQGRPEHRTGTRTGQVRLSAWRGHRTCMRMENPCSPARQGRADVSPEHGLGGRSRPALRCSPQISGTRDGPVGGAKYVSLRQTLDMDMPGKPRALQAIIRMCAGQSASAHLASLG